MARSIKREKSQKISIGLLSLLYFGVVQFSYFASKLKFYGYLKPYLPIIATALSVIAMIVASKKKTLKPRTILLYVITAVICYLIYKISDNATILYIPLTVPFVIKENIETVAKTDIASKITIAALIIISNWLGFAEKVILERNGLERATLGFHHPNALGYILVSTLIDITILNRDNRTIKPILIGLTFITIAIAADSRTSIISLIVLIVINIPAIKARISNRKKEPSRLIALIPLLMFIASIALTGLYRNNLEIINNLNETFSGRISIQSRYYNNYPIKLLGQKIDFTNHPLDNSYYQVLFNYGLAGISLMLFLYISSLQKAANSKEYIILLMLVLLSIMAVMENNPSRIAITPIVLYSFCKIRNRGIK